MGLFQKAIETYDNVQNIAGMEIEGKAVLAPVGFISTDVQIVITLTEAGDFVKAERLDAKSPKKIIIPATEKSAGRTSSAASVTPHPLCDKLMFMRPCHVEGNRAYIRQLEEWCNFDPTIHQLSAVLKYVKEGTICEDLSNINGIKEDDFVCWRVLTNDTNESENLWLNKRVIDSYVRFCQQKVNEISEPALCYVSGEILPKAGQHKKGVVPMFGNAKLVSSNDESNYTYRGRFKNDEEAMTMSYSASQKAHNALQWLVANDRVTFGDRTLICWNPQGKKIPKPTVSLFSLLHEDTKISCTNYRDALSKTIMGYRSNLNMDDETVLAIFEAATTGRLSISYYSEMKAVDFLERLRFWDDSSAWPHYKYGIFSPNLNDIVDAAYGTLQTKSGRQELETEGKVKAIQIQRLLLCRLEKAPFPADIMRSAVQKCGMLQLYDEASFNRQKMIFVTCAIIRKYKFDHNKEEWLMALEPEKKNRSYQFGRLLAVMEKAERDTYEPNVKREPSAIRMQAIFVKRPVYAGKIILENLKNAYYPRLSPGTQSYYEKLIGEIMLQISECQNGYKDQPLSEEYLLGYYLQKESLYTKRTNNNETEEK